MSVVERRYSNNQPNKSERKDLNNAPKNDITTEFTAKSIHKYKSDSDKMIRKEPRFTPTIIFGPQFATKSTTQSNAVKSMFENFSTSKRPAYYSFENSAFTQKTMDLKGQFRRNNRSPQEFKRSSQSGQDEFVQVLLQNKTNKYFVDLAANH
jgi:hypothetical protein